MNHLCLSVFLPATTLLLFTGSALSQNDREAPSPDRLKEAPRLVTLFSQGRGTVEADSATVFLRHIAEAPKLADAIAIGAAAKQQILARLTEAGLPKDAISFENFTSDSQHGKLTGRVKSYTVSSPINIKVTDASQFAAVAVVVDADPNLEYLRRVAKIGDESAAQMDAAENAVENLRRKAALYEKSFGVELELFSFSEISQKAMNEGVPVPMYSMDSDSIDSLLATSARKTYSPVVHGTTERFGEVTANVFLQGWYRVVSP